jgi:hypothetical protein
MELQNEELYSFYTSPNTIRVIKWTRLAGMKRAQKISEMHTKFWSENVKTLSKDLGVDGKIILKWILGK